MHRPRRRIGRRAIAPATSSMFGLRRCSGRLLQPSPTVPGDVRRTPAGAGDHVCRRVPVGGREKWSTRRRRVLRTPAFGHCSVHPRPLCRARGRRVALAQELGEQRMERGDRRVERTRRGTRRPAARSRRPGDTEIGATLAASSAERRRQAAVRGSPPRSTRAEAPVSGAESPPAAVRRRRPALGCRKLSFDLIGSGSRPLADNTISAHSAAENTNSPDRSPAAPVAAARCHAGRGARRSRRAARRVGLEERRTTARASGASSSASTSNTTTSGSTRIAAGPRRRPRPPPRRPPARGRRPVARRSRRRSRLPP
jgi:hypothetical protein